MQKRFKGTALALVLGCSAALGLSGAALAQTQSQPAQTGAAQQAGDAAKQAEQKAGDAAKQAEGAAQQAEQKAGDAAQQAEQKADQATGSQSSDTAATTPEPSAGETGDTASGGQADTGATQLGSINAEQVIGQSVVNAAGEDVGEVQDLVVDPQDKSVYAVVSVGGFLGIGDKNVAVPFDQLQMGDDNVVLMSQASEDELKNMPAYEEGTYQSLQGGQQGQGAPVDQGSQQ